MSAQSSFLYVDCSASGRRWVDRLSPAEQIMAQALREHSDIPDVLARILAGRGVTLDSVEEELNPSLRTLLPGPSCLTQMNEAARLLADAIEQRKSIALFGDYDVDGACSVALFGRYLTHFGLQPTLHIPDRITEGYGPNIPAIERFALDGVQMLITLDCGTTSFAPLARAKELGLQVVVIDHHLSDAQLPAADAIINPNRQDDLSGLGHLCAAGVAFVTLVALNRELRQRGAFCVAQTEPDLMAWLDMVALATIADVVPLKGLNRAFVLRGLMGLRKRSSLGLTALQDVSRIGGPIEAYHLGFLLGPRINAGGRIGDAALGARLLMCNDAEEAGIIAQDLDRLNRERQVIEQAIVEEAMQEAERAMGHGAGSAVLVTSADHWHPGVVGLVASRLKEKFRKPSFAIAFNGETGTGSGRSIQGVDLGRAVREAVNAGILLKGGGHAMAAGLTIHKDKMPELRAFFESHLARLVAAHTDHNEVSIDAAVVASSATAQFIASMERAGPFGQGRPDPVFAFPAHRIVYADEVGAGHVRLTLQGSDGTRIKAVAFRVAQEPLGQALLAKRGQSGHFVGYLSLDHWQGDARPSLRLIDAAFI